MEAESHKASWESELTEPGAQESDSLGTDSPSGLRQDAQRKENLCKVLSTWSQGAVVWKPSSAGLSL